MASPAMLPILSLNHIYFLNNNNHACFCLGCRARPGAPPIRSYRGRALVDWDEWSRIVSQSDDLRKCENKAPIPPKYMYGFAGGFHFS